LHQVDEVAVVSVFSFSGMPANTRDVLFAIVSWHQLGFACNRDQWLFFLAAMLFSLPAGTRPGRSIVG